MDSQQNPTPPPVERLSTDQPENTNTPHPYGHPFAIILEKTPEGTVLRLDYHEGSKGKPFSKAINIEQFLAYAETIAQQSHPNCFLRFVLCCADDTFAMGSYYFTREGIRESIVSCDHPSERFPMR